MDEITWLSHLYSIYILDMISRPTLKKVGHAKTRYLDAAGEGVNMYDQLKNMNYWNRQQLYIIRNIQEQIKNENLRLYKET